MADCRVPDQRRRGIEDAVRALGRDDLVVFPTDGVYGLAADAFRRKAVQGLHSVKGRGSFGVPVMVGAWATLEGLVDVISTDVEELIHAFWPGGLTLVLRPTGSLDWDIGETRNTMSVRMPLHPVALEVLRRVGPLAVTSANAVGSPPPTDCQAAEADFGEAVAVYLDAGAALEPTPSSVVDCTGDQPKLLRAGAVSAAALQRVLPHLVVPD